jgi:hypothetical protein
LGLAFIIPSEDNHIMHARSPACTAGYSGLFLFFLPVMKPRAEHLL